MTDDKLAEIEARLMAATPGPWFVNVCPAWPGDSKRETNHQIRQREDDVIIAEIIDCLRDDPANAMFIAHARTDIPALIAEIRRLKSQIKTVPVAGRVVKDGKIVEGGSNVG